MIDVRKLHFSLIAALLGGAISTAAIAQDAATPATDAAPAVAAPAAATTLAPAAGETLKAFLIRVSQSNFDDTAQIVANLLKSDPASFAQLIALRDDPDVGSSVLSEAGKGLIAAAEASPVVIAEQVSALALSNAASVSQIIKEARESNSIVLSEIFGEGLAMAANKATRSGDIVRAAAIQSQATSREAPIALSEAFLDNALQTAAGNEFAGFLGAGGGGDIANNVNGILSNSSGNDTGNSDTATQAAYSSLSLSRTTTNTVTSGTTATASATSPAE